MLRSIGAVVAGYLTMAVGVLVVVGIGAALLVDDPEAPGNAYLAFNLGASVLAAAGGGWVTRRLAVRSPVKHVLALAAAVLLLGLAMAMGGPAASQPAWYPATMSVLGAAGVLAGGILGARRRGSTTSAVGSADL